MTHLVQDKTEVSFLFISFHRPIKLDAIEVQQAPTAPVIACLKHPQVPIERASTIINFERVHEIRTVQIRTVPLPVDLLPLFCVVRRLDRPRPRVVAALSSTERPDRVVRRRDPTRLEVEADPRVRLPVRAKLAFLVAETNDVRRRVFLGKIWIRRGRESDFARDAFRGVLLEKVEDSVELAFR